MSAFSEVWNLLVKAGAEDRWADRAEIELVGGWESMRRLREVRKKAVPGGFYFQQRVTDGGLLEYRMVPLSDKPTVWACSVCGSAPFGELQPSTDADDRWRFGTCPTCAKHHVIFERR